jgi:hypothetical protein
MQKKMPKLLPVDVHVKHESLVELIYMLFLCVIMLFLFVASDFLVFVLKELVMRGCWCFFMSSYVCKSSLFGCALFVKGNLRCEECKEDLSGNKLLEGDVFILWGS